jgi:hypothetical protein
LLSVQCATLLYSALSELLEALTIERPKWGFQPHAAAANLDHIFELMSALQWSALGPCIVIESLHQGLSEKS